MNTEKKDSIVFEGKVLECDSLYELKAGTSFKEWEQVLKETVEFYCLMKAAQSISPGKVEKKDIRLLRRLKRTVEFCRKLDPAAMMQFDIEQMVNVQTEHLKKGWENFRSTIRIAEGDRPDNNADIYISRI